MAKSKARRRRIANALGTGAVVAFFVLLNVGVWFNAFPIRPGLDNLSRPSPPYFWTYTAVLVDGVAIVGLVAYLGRRLRKKA
jgi:hypothetical protein